MNPTSLLRAIAASIAAIRAEQRPDGGFLHTSGGETHTTVFLAANILACLNSVPECPAIRESIARFLLAQKSEHWSFNYWAHESREKNFLPYPDDLDDTFVALAALYGWDPAIIDGRALACVAKILTTLEVAPGGPYRTWLVAASAQPEWRDVDLVVNTNVGYFLSLVGISLPNLSRFVDECIRLEDLRSPYYPGVIQSVYCISRFYHGAGRAALADALFPVHNSLETAMAVSALINLGFAEKIPSDAIEVLLALAESGSWAPDPFCIDPARDGKMQFAGSPALTAAFCAEALAKYASWHAEVAESGNGSIMAKPDLARIKTMAQAHCSALPEDLRQLAGGVIEEVANTEIVMVPYAAHASVRKHRDMPARLLDELALANLYGWIAYSIYDDFFDGEAGDVVQLAVANYFLRALTLQYAELDHEIPGIREEFIKIMDIIDAANAAEQMHSGANQFAPDTLADRSLGHALPALAVFMAVGCAPDSRDAAALISCFKNYLAARQLHDDAHDWKDDLRRGRVNGAARRMFAMRHEPGDGIENDATLSRLGAFFWRVALPRIVADILDFLHEARHALAAIEILDDSELFEALLVRLESAAERTLREQEEAIQFLDSYAPHDSFFRTHDLQTP